MYIDLDGVVYPFESLSRVTPMPEGIRALNDNEWWDTRVAKRLGSMAVERVVCSSWGEEFMGTDATITSPLEDLKPDRVLKLAPSDGARAKENAVLRDSIRSVPEAHIWIDDDLFRSPTYDDDPRGGGHTMVEYVEAGLRAHFGRDTPPHLWIMPESTKGLTGDELDEIEAFISTHMTDR